MVLNAIIVDDELTAIKTLETIIKDYCPNVKIIAKTTSPVEAIELIKEKKPHLVFLDIDMPEMDGFQMLESIPEKNFEVIFITASNHHAINAFKVSAIDYILKPVNVPEVINAVNRVEKSYKTEKTDFTKYITLFENFESNLPEKIALPTSSGIEIVLPEDIIYVEAFNNYSTFHISDGRKIMVSKTIGYVESLIATDDFLRIHKTNIINMRHIESYNLSKSGGDITMKNGKKLVLSRRTKQNFIDKIENRIRKF